jgi:hypothetical protein
VATLLLLLLLLQWPSGWLNQLRDMTWLCIAFRW